MAPLMPSPPGPPASRSRSRSADQTTDRARLNRVWETTVAPCHRSAIPNTENRAGCHTGGHPVQNPGGYEDRARPNRRPQENEAGRIHRGSPTLEHSNAPLDARGIVSLDRSEGERFESKDSHETAGGSQGTSESMYTVFQEYTREIETK